MEHRRFVFDHNKPTQVAYINKKYGSNAILGGIVFQDKLIDGRKGTTFDLVEDKNSDIRIVRTYANSWVDISEEIIGNDKIDLTD